MRHRLVAAGAHRPQLLLAPAIKRVTAHEADVHTEAAVNAGAVDADECAMAHRSPVRCDSAAVDTVVISALVHEFFEERVRCLLVDFLVRWFHLIDVSDYLFS